MITILGIVFTDLLKGIGMGVAVTMFMIIRNNYRNSLFMHKKEQNNGNPQITMRLAEEVTYLNKGSIQKQLSQLEDGTDLTIDMRGSVRVDYDVFEIIENFKNNTAKDKNIDVTILRGKTLDYVTADY